MNHKKNTGFFLVSMLLLLVTNSLYSQSDTLMVSGESGNPGSTGNVVSIHLINTVEVAGIQFVLADSPNVLTGNGASLTDRTSDFVLNVQYNDTNLVVLLFDASGRTIAPSSGAIIELLYDVDAGATPQSVSLELSGVIVSDTLAQQIPVVQVDGTFLVTQTNVVNGERDAIPSSFNLSQNCPNPFNASTEISYSIPNPGFVTLKIYSILGREIQTLVNQFQAADTYSVGFNASQVSSGIYFYRLQVGNDFIKTRKMVFLP